MNGHEFIAVIVILAVCFFLLVVIIVMLDAKTHARIDELEQRIAAREKKAKT